MTPTLELRIVDPGFVVRSNTGADHQEVRSGEPVRKGHLIFLTIDDFATIEAAITHALGLGPKGE